MDGRKTSPPSLTPRPMFVMPTIPNVHNQNKPRDLPFVVFHPVFATPRHTIGFIDKKDRHKPTNKMYQSLKQSAIQTNMKPTR